MKILFVTNEVPFPPDNGIRIVSYNAMRLMNEAGHDLALAVLGQNKIENNDNLAMASAFCVKNMVFYKKICIRNKWLILFKSIFLNKLYPIERNYDEEFIDKLNHLITKFKPDVVHFDTITMVQYYKFIPVGIATIGSINDSYAFTMKNMFATNRYSGLHYLYRLIQYFQALSYEKSEYKNLTCMHLMTEVDANVLKGFNSKIETRSISNGVNPDLFEINEITINQTDLIFVSKLEGANLHSLKQFLKSCWPAIHRYSPKTKFYIVGGMNEEVLKLSQNLNDNVIFTGYVDNLKEAYSKCGIAIVPINKNCGIINKIIEAMAAGIAVVGFDKSFMGITGAIKDKHFVSVADFEHMASAVIDLLSDIAKCQAIKKSAYILAREKYSWDSRLKQYENMYKESILKIEKN